MSWIPVTVRLRPVTRRAHIKNLGAALVAVVILGSSSLPSEHHREVHLPEVIPSRELLEGLRLIAQASSIVITGVPDASSPPPTLSYVDFPAGPGSAPRPIA